VNLELAKTDAFCFGRKPFVEICFNPFASIHQTYRNVFIKANYCRYENVTTVSSPKKYAGCNLMIGVGECILLVGGGGKICPENNNCPRNKQFALKLTFLV